MRKDMKPLLISFSGGRTSGMMTAILQDYQPERPKAIVFANTGKEHEKTLEFVSECDKRWGLGVVWVEAVIHPEAGKGTTHKIVSFETASRKGEPYEAMLKKYGIPSVAFPHCTRELKLRPIEHYVKTVLGWGDYDRAIGLRADERHREAGYFYPLMEYGIDKQMVNEWWSRQPFNLDLEEFEGNCDLCFKKSDKKLVKAINKTKSALVWWEEMERKYAHLEHGNRSAKLEPSYFFRGNRSADEMRWLANEAAKQRNLFDSLSEVEYDCHCKAM